LKFVVNELLVIPVMRIRALENAQFMLTKRFIEGVEAYSKLWSDSITVLVRPTANQGEGLDPVIFNPDEHKFNVEILPEDDNLLKERLKCSTLVLGTLANENLKIGKICGSINLPLVWVT